MAFVAKNEKDYYTHILEMFRYLENMLWPRVPWQTEKALASEVLSPHPGDGLEHLGVRSGPSPAFPCFSVCISLFVVFSASICLLGRLAVR